MKGQICYCHWFWNWFCPLTFLCRLNRALLQQSGNHLLFQVQNGIATGDRSNLAAIQAENKEMFVNTFALHPSLQCSFSSLLHVYHILLQLYQIWSLCHAYQELEISIVIKARKRIISSTRMCITFHILITWPK